MEEQFIRDRNFCQFSGDLVTSCWVFWARSETYRNHLSAIVTSFQTQNTRNLQIRSSGCGYGSIIGFLS